MTILRKFPKLFAVLLIALGIGAASTVAAPAFASADADRTHELTITKVAPGNVSPDTVCQGPILLDFAYAVFFCDIDVDTTFTATCADGFVFPPFALPPGPWRIDIDCFPAAFGTLTWTP